MPTEHGCIVCGSTIQEGLEPDLLNDGSRLEIVTGYGSKFDGEVFKGYICDNCIEAKENSGDIIFVRDYLYPNFTPEMREMTKRDRGDS